MRRPGDNTRLISEDGPQGGWHPTTVQIKDGQTLIPGGNCLAHPGTWNNGVFTANTVHWFTIYDTAQQAYAFSLATPLVHREKIQVYYSPFTQRYETFCPFGLFRKAKSDSTITAGGNGTCSLYIGSTDTLLNLVGYLDWAEGGTNLASNKELFLEWKLDEEKWQITGAEC